MVRDTIQTMIRSTLLQQFPELVHGMSDRQAGNTSIAVGGYEPVMAARHLFYSQLGIEQQRVVLSQQTHSTIVAEVTAEHQGLADGNQSPFSVADALITRQPGCYLAVFTADCLPILFYDPIEQIVAAVHAGWRGVGEGIIDETIKTFQAYGSSADHLRVWIGPHIKACHYDLDPRQATYDDKLSLFQSIPEAIVERADHQFLDLTSVAVRQLRERGIVGPNLEISPDCTACHPDQYFSYRQQDSFPAGRMMALIGLSGA